MKRIEDYIRGIEDFPKKGVVFRDITTLSESPDGFELAINEMLKRLERIEFDSFAALESRGYIFAAPMAYLLHKPLVMIRKKGKLPRKTVSEEYELEYGNAAIEMHVDSVREGQRVVIVDDLVATGGTVMAAVKMIERLGGTVAMVLGLIELAGLGAREALADYNLECLVTYEE